MTFKLISVARDFSKAPAGRFVTDGPFPGETFRDQILVPAFKECQTVVVDLNGTAGYGSSFLEEAFGGLVRRGHSEEELQRRMKLESERQSYVERIWAYIHKAEAEGVRA